MEKIEKLSDLTKDELLAVAEQFGTEVRSSISKKDLLVRLADDGVDVDLYNGWQVVEEEYDAKELGLHPAAPGELEETAQEVEVDEKEDELVLVKMTRTNGTYEVRGYLFTREHPYLLVKEEDADYLIEVEGGFRATSPKEVREFYS